MRPLVQHGVEACELVPLRIVGELGGEAELQPGDGRQQRRDQAVERLLGRELLQGDLERRRSGHAVQQSCGEHHHFV